MNRMLKLGWEEQDQVRRTPTTAEQVRRTPTTAEVEAIQRQVGNEDFNQMLLNSWNRIVAESYAR